MAMLHSMDPRYTITDQSRRNVAYECMPTELQKILDTEMSKGNLPDWRAMREFLISFSDSDAVSRSVKPAPISANAVTEGDKPEEPEYTDDEWVYYRGQPDG